MTRCYPEQPEFAADRAAERTVWEALRVQLPDDAVLLHSLGFTDQGNEREADLVVAWPGIGIAVIEVKGGNVTSCARKQGKSTSYHRSFPHAGLQLTGRASTQSRILCNGVECGHRRSHRSLQRSVARTAHTPYCCLPLGPRVARSTVGLSRRAEPPRSIGPLARWRVSRFAPCHCRLGADLRFVSGC